MGLKVSYEAKDFVKPEDGRFLALYPVAIDAGAHYMMRTGPESRAVLRSHYAYYNSALRSLWFQTGVRLAF
jgi:hypothetical protein